MPLDNDDLLVEIYSRKQSNTVFKFYVKNKRLIVETINGDDVQQLPIDGIPLEFQTNLNEGKVAKIKVMFEQCYFGKQRGKVLVNARGLGGWRDEQHRGFYYDGEGDIKFILSAITGVAGYGVGKYVDEKIEAKGAKKYVCRTIGAASLPLITWTLYDQYQMSARLEMAGLTKKAEYNKDQHGEGTYQWALSSSFGEPEATVIANACVAVDLWPESW